MTQDPALGTYVLGRLGLAGIELSAPLDVWLNAVYAAYADAPHEVLDKLMRRMVIEEAKLRPQDARATWGLRPEHRAMSGKLTSGKGVDGGPTKALPDLPRGTRSRHP